MASSPNPESCSQALPCAVNSSGLFSSSSQRWPGAELQRIKLPVWRGSPSGASLSRLAGGQLGKTGLVQDARASTMEGFSHPTPPFRAAVTKAKLTPRLWAEDGGGVGRGGEVIQKALPRWGRKAVGWGRGWPLPEGLFPARRALLWPCLLPASLSS